MGKSEVKVIIIQWIMSLSLNAKSTNCLKALSAMPKIREVIRDRCSSKSVRYVRKGHGSYFKLVDFGYILP